MKNYLENEDVGFVAIVSRYGIEVPIFIDESDVSIVSERNPILGHAIRIIEERKSKVKK